MGVGGGSVLNSGWKRVKEGKSREQLREVKPEE